LSDCEKEMNEVKTKKREIVNLIQALSIMMNYAANVLL
jgi:hypothetical protein